MLKYRQVVLSLLSHALPSAVHHLQNGQSTEIENNQTFSLSLSLSLSLSPGAS